MQSKVRVYQNDKMLDLKFITRFFRPLKHIVHTFYYNYDVFMRMSILFPGMYSPLPWTVRPVQSLSACRRVHFLLTYSTLLATTACGIASCKHV